MNDGKHVVVLAPGEEKRIDAEFKALEDLGRSTGELNVRMLLRVHQEYPKHVAGKSVNNADEEKAALAAAGEEKAAAADSK